MAELARTGENNSVESNLDDSKSPSLLEASLDGKDGASSDRFASIDPKKLLRKIDWHVLPYIIVCYMVVRLDLNSEVFLSNFELSVRLTNFLSTTDINNAGTMNKETGDSLKQVLNLDAKQWAWVSATLSRVFSCFETHSQLLYRLSAASTIPTWYRKCLSRQSELDIRLSCARE
jgi:hypothetical protein